MKNKKQIFLALPILISAASVCVATSSYASLYKAKTNWSVDSDASSDYCSASQGYSNKAYLTFAKRVDGSISLAVDFQKSSFVKGKKHSFKVKVGEVVQSFKIEPSSENAVVFPLGSDNKIINALSSNSILNLSIDGVTHDFSIRDAGKLSNSLSGCVTKMMPAQQMNVDKEVYNAGSDDQILKTDTSSELAKLMMENERLESLLKQVRRDSDSRIASMTSNPYTEEAKEKAFVLEKENKRLKADLSSFTALKAKLEDVKSVESQLEQETQNSSALQEKLNLANKRISDLAKQNTQIAKNVNTNKVAECLDNGKDLKISNYESDLKGKEDKISMLMGQNAELEKKIKGHVQALSRKTDGDASAYNKFKDIEKLYNVAVADIESLKSKNADLEVKIKEQQKNSNSNKSISEEYSLLEKRYDTAINDLDALRNKNAESNKQVKVLENQLAGMMDKSSVANGSSDEGWNLEKATQRYQEAQREIVNLGRMVEQGSAKCSAEKKDIESMLFDPEIAGTEQRIKLSSMEEDIESKDSTISNLRSENENINSRKNEVISNLEAEKLSLGSEIAALEARKSMLETEKNKLEFDKKNVESDKAKVENEKLSLEANLNDVTSSKNRLIAELEVKNESLEDDIKNLMNDITLVEEEKKVMAAEYDENLRSGVEEVVNVKMTEMETEKDVVIAELQSDKEEVELELNRLLKAIEDAGGAEGFLDDRQEKLPVVEEVKLDNMADVSPKVNDNKNDEDVIVVVKNIEETKTKEPISKPATVETSSYLKDVINTIPVTSKVTAQSKNGMNIFRWKKDDLHGIAIEKPLASGVTLADGVNAYIDRAQSKCSGDFAAIPSLQGDSKQTYEIACVKPNGKGSSASLLFLKNDNNMITIAHEGRTDLMEKAINARDAINENIDN